MLRRAWAMAATLLLLGAALAEGPYCVVEGGVAALVDAGGNDIVPQGVYEEIFPVIPGSLYSAGKVGDYALLDASGRVISDGHFGMIDDGGGALLFRKGWRYGAMDRTGATLVEPVWTQLICDGRGGFLAVAGNAIDEIADALCHVDASGASTETGVSALGLMRRVSDDRLAVCGADGLWGYVNGAGEPVIPFEWLSAGDFEDGRAIVMGEEGCGVIDAEGNVRVEPEYAYIARCGVRFAALDGLGQLDIYDVDSCRCVARLDGTVTGLTPLGDAMAVSDGARTMLINELGQAVCSLSEEATFAAGDIGQYIATEGPWGEANSWVVNSDGSAATGKYQRLQPLCEGRYAFVTMNGVEYYSELLGGAQKSWDYDSQRYGLLDAGGRELLPAEYRQIRALDDERLVLLTDGAVILADRDGNPIRTWARRATTSDETGE